VTLFCYLKNDENVHVFGKCNHPGGHGHNYVLEVTVRGTADSRTGMVMNLSDLKQVIRASVLNQLDHRNIDIDVDFFRETRAVSTTENLAVYIWKCLQVCWSKPVARIVFILYVNSFTFLREKCH